MNLTRKAAPAELAVTLKDAVAQLREDEEDVDIGMLVTAWLEGIISHAEHLMSRSIITQTWVLKVDKFSDSIPLPMGTVQAVTHIKYLDSGGAKQTLDASKYELAGDHIVPAFGEKWPATRPHIHAVEVEYKAGFGDTAAATPHDVKLYILAKLTEQFDPEVKPQKDTVQSSFIDGLLGRYKVWAI